MKINVRPLSKHPCKTYSRDFTLGNASHFGVCLQKTVILESECKSKTLPLCSAPLKNLVVGITGALGNERKPLSKQNIFSENAVE